MSETEQKASVCLVIERSLKQDSAEVVASSPFLVEDIYSDYYYTGRESIGNLIKPPIHPANLRRIVERNNILMQCIEAMEVNIDGTGWELAESDPEVSSAAKKKEHQELTDFFSEVSPGMSWTAMKRELRVDLESTGNAYVEVLRTSSGKVAFLRRLDPSLMRLVRLDAPVPVKYTVQRGGEQVTFTLPLRERRYAQLVETKLQYYREYGSSRRVNRITGAWVKDGERIAANQVGTEVLHLKVKEDSETPYGIPRWYNNTPSAIGSRKAEEFNLGYFDAGGLPPAVVFLKGGSMAAEAAETLRGFLSGRVSDKQRAVIVEMYSNAGTLDANSRVDVQVERFGWESTRDSMFRDYDKDSENKIRCAFRLPQLFVGQSNEMNFAAAYAAYLVAEAQVFQPERLAEDEIFNRLLVREFKTKHYKLRSMPLNIRDVAIQLKAVDLVSDRIDPESMVKSVNDLTGLKLQYSQETYDFYKSVEGSKRQRVNFTDSNTNMEAAAAPGNR